MRLVDWSISLPLVVVLTAIAVAFEPALRIAHRFGRDERVARSLCTAFIRVLAVAGTRFEVSQSVELAADRGYVLVANHQGMLDVPLIQASLPRHVGFVARRSLTRGIPSVSYALRTGPHALVDSADPVGSMREIRRLGKRASERGAVVAIFPEGTRARSGTLGEFNWAGALILLSAAPGLAVVPVTIDGSWIFSRNSLLPVPFGTRVRLDFGEPIDVGTDAMPALEEAFRAITKRLEEWRE
jgi:1-acyl-sn-glycerol-3-phosphate acyltransferase